MKLTDKRNVRILLVGDRGVGKTSLILSLVSEEFPEDVPAKSEEITIPADVIPEMIPTQIVDYSAVEQTDDQLLVEIRRAHVICVVFSVDDDRSLQRATTYWLPLLRESLYTQCPVILVGNKVDLIDGSTLDSAEEVMEQFPEVECFVEVWKYFLETTELVQSMLGEFSQASEQLKKPKEIRQIAISECSAKTLKNISEVFYYAQKAVLHPIAPIYMTEKNDLTEECKLALSRIFKICDVDNDGLLNDRELNAFQKRCFDMPLRPEAMEDVKAVVKRNKEGGVSSTNCITLPGFLYLHCLFIQRGRSHTTWTVLRKFGYNDNLSLSKEYLYPSIRVPSGCSTELSHKGQMFFSNLFTKYDRDKDGALSSKEQKSMFSICPSPPWGPDYANIIPTNAKGRVTLQGFLCFWNLTAYRDLPTLLEYLAYLGYPITDVENQLSAIQVTRERNLDLLKKQSTRNVYVCHVIGARGVGKSTLCRTLLGHSTTDCKDVTGVPQTTIQVLYVYGQEKYLIMKDVDGRTGTEPLSPTDACCDVACLVYDSTNPKTFEYIARVYMKYFEGSRVPVLIVSTKWDLGQEVRQDYYVQPSAFCDTHRLAPPHKFTAAGDSASMLQLSQKTSTELFQKLATMAAFPHLTELTLPSGESVLWKAGLGIALLAAVGVIITKFISSERR